MKILILNQHYPDYRKSGHVSSFVETRVNQYKKKHDVKILKVTSEDSYYFQNEVFVKEAKNFESAENFISELNPDVIFIHFVERWMFEISALKKIPTYIWVHGSEALGWWRILFSLHQKNWVKFFLNFVYINMVCLYDFRRIVKYSNKHQNPKFIFVSNWMLKIASTDTLSIPKHFSVIPNPIDDEFFSYKSKESNFRLKILLIRSFNSSKYANDISINAILKLSKESFFKDLKFTIIGEGIHFDRLTSRVKKFENVELINRLLSHEEVKLFHDKNGVFLCPTRMDAQGVSMCEAMASGLVPIASDNTAIPEFVKNGHSGLLRNNSKGVAKAIKELYHNKELFVKLSENAAKEIRLKCGIKKTILKELQLVDNNS